VRNSDLRYGKISPILRLIALTGDGTKVEDVFMGVWPFILCDVIVLVMLFLFPQIVLYLPNAMLGN
jgi:C4-dicarboxylate transporter DctM subunit